MFDCLSIDTEEFLCYLQDNVLPPPKLARQSILKGCIPRQPCLYFRGSEGVFSSPIFETSTMDKPIIYLHEQQPDGDIINSDTDLCLMTQIVRSWATCLVSLLVNVVWCHKSDHPHDDVIKWKHFPRYWPYARGIHRPPAYSPHKGQWRGALTFSSICTRKNGWVNNGEAGDLRRHRAHYDVPVMPIVNHSKTDRIKRVDIYSLTRCGQVAPYGVGQRGQHSLQRRHMSVMACQITGVSMVYSTVCSGADQRKHKSSVSLAFVRRNHLLRVKCFHLMTSSCWF